MSVSVYASGCVSVCVCVVISTCFYMTFAGVFLRIKTYPKIEIPHAMITYSLSEQRLLLQCNPHRVAAPRQAATCMHAAVPIPPPTRLVLVYCSSLRAFGFWNSDVFHARNAAYSLPSRDVQSCRLCPLHLSDVAIIGKFKHGKEQ